MNLSSVTTRTLAKIRPPFARSAKLLFAFGSEGRVNNGITVEMEEGEPAIAPGVGNVVSCTNAGAQWQTSSDIVKHSNVFSVTIDHGNGVKTTVSGMRNSLVSVGDKVQRGDSLGEMLTTQLYVELSVANRRINPLQANSHWRIQNGNHVTGQGGKIRFAPDRIVRDLSNGVTAIINSGISYFKQAVNPTPLLVNIAFNGDGSKQGLAATGFTAADYWNTYSPVSFTSSPSGACPYFGPSFGFYTFSSEAVVHLYDYAENRSSVVLERIAPLGTESGTGFSWDEMLRFWIGSYSGFVPYENSFRLRGMPAGDYRLYLYADQGALPYASAFYVAVGSGSAVEKTNNPSGDVSFVENRNYVVYELTLASGESITVRSVGYFSGLQLIRV